MPNDDNRCKVPQTIKIDTDLLVSKIEHILDKHVRVTSECIASRTWAAIQKWIRLEEDGYVFYPPDTKFYYRKGASELYVIESKPCMRTLFLHSIHERKSCTFRLAMPYMAFFFMLRDTKIHVKVCFLDGPLKGGNDKVYLPYLYNVKSDLSVCMGSVDTHRDRSRSDFENISQLMNAFWNSIFTVDHTLHVSHYQSRFFLEDKRLASFENWAAASSQDPLFVMDGIQWTSHPFRDKVASVCKDMFIGCGEDSVFTNEIYHSVFDEFKKEFMEKICQYLASK